MKVITLNKEDTKKFKEQGYLFIDKYLLVYDRSFGGFEFGVNPEDAKFYDEDDDEVEELYYDEESTEIYDYDDYYEEDYDDYYEVEDDE